MNPSIYIKMLRAADRSHAASMKILLEAGASPNATNRWNQVPLHMVVDEGDGI